MAVSLVISLSRGKADQILILRYDICDTINRSTNDYVDPYSPLFLSLDQHYLTRICHVVIAVPAFFNAVCESLRRGSAQTRTTILVSLRGRG